MDGPIRTAGEDYKPLTDQEINAFFEDIDTDKDGSITFHELEAKLHKVHEELAPEPQKHHLHHPSRRDLEKNVGHAGDGIHAFLCSIMPDCGSSFSREEFVRRVKSWEVPSQKQTDSKEQADEDNAAERRLPFRRRLRAKWAVHGPVYCFMAFVVALQIAFGVWQMVEYIEKPLVRAALGWV